MSKLRCTAISDTHTKHDELELFGGDILFHTGDATFLGQPDEVYPFLEWMSKQDYEHKIFIAGNHDLGWEPIGEGIMCDTDGKFRFRTFKLKKGLEKEYGMICDDLGLTYLHEQSIIIDGVKIYGSPYQPEFCGWAFNTTTYQAEQIVKRWPKDIDVLLTHGPARGIRDKVQRRSFSDGYDPRTGCKAIKQYIKEHKPSYHIFGHIHESYGVTRGKDTISINASSCQRNYRDLNRPINFHINLEDD